MKNTPTTVALTLVFAFFAEGIAQSESAGQDKHLPNVIFILADDVGTGDIKCYHEPTKVKTANIDQLAAEGMRFTQAYAPGSVCSPSRYALLTGFYPCRGPLRETNARSYSPLTIDTDALTLPRFFKNHGYRTAHIGKWHLGYGESGIKNWAGEISPGPLEIGFDYHLGLPSNHNDKFKTYIENHKLLWLKDSITELPDRPTEEDLDKIRMDDEVDSTLTNKAIEFITGSPKQPFFLYLAMVATHTHITPDKNFRGTSKIGQLGDYIHELDFHVGEIMTTLEDHNLADNTILFFSSDNGGAENDVSSAGKGLDLRDESHDVATKARSAKTDARVKFGHRTNGNLRGHKGSNFEGGFRVPLIVRWPGKVAAGSQTSQIITLADMLSTSAGLLGKKLPESAGGDSFDLSPVLMGQESVSPIHTTTILQTGNNRLAFRQGDWKIRCSKPTRWTGQKALVRKEDIELYHLRNDPAETTDLAADHPKRVAAMRKVLMKLVEAGRSR